MMAIFTLYCTICAVRINLVFFLAFFFLFFTFLLVALAQWISFQQGMMEVGTNLKIVSSFFYVSLCMGANICTRPVVLAVSS